MTTPTGALMPAVEECVQPLPVEVAIAAGDELDPKPKSASTPTAASPAATCATSSLTSTPCCQVGGRTCATATRTRKFAAIDSYVHWRMAKLASVKYATGRRLRASRFTHNWLTDLGIYRLTGTVRYWSAANA
jgi:hypothetical protein